jgi:predicted nucleotidyltransferase
MSDYKLLVSEYDIDLLVINTKDEDQLAMHGLAYPLTVELRDRAMLLL